MLDLLKANQPIAIGVGILTVMLLNNFWPQIKARLPKLGGATKSTDPGLDLVNAIHQVRACAAACGENRPDAINSMTVKDLTAFAVERILDPV